LGDATTVLASGIVWALVVAGLIWRAARRGAAHRHLPAEPLPDPAPSVAVIVPARNEARNIGPCLEGLVAQDYPGRLSITVVDDESADGTVAIVGRHVEHDQRVRLLAGGPPPPGWFGKPHACWVGAAAADADWLCFVDADVRAEPGLLAGAVAFAARSGTDMLSLYPFLTLGSFWERVVVPAGLLVIACALPAGTPDRSSHGGVTANGQFILIRRAAYDAIGGHRAVREEVCEDRALALRLLAGGMRLGVMGGERLARVRMYTGLRPLWAGFAKNAVEVLGDPPATLGAAAATAAIAIASLLVPGLAALATALHPGWPASLGLGLAALASAALLGLGIGTARHLRIPWAYGLSLPLGSLLVALIALDSLRRRARRTVTWKGRRYRAGTAGPTILPADPGA
jgi:chlorobactene glucosyltransferase